MNLIADVILPVFCVPYVVPFVFPLAGVATVVAEVVVFKLLNRHLGLGKIIALVIVANVVSTIVGFFIAAFLPSGYVWKVVETEGRRSGTFEPVPLHNTYLVMSFFLAFLLSVVIEYPIVRAFADWAKVNKPLITVTLANVASYIALVALALILSQ